MRYGNELDGYAEVPDASRPANVGPGESRRTVHCHAASVFSVT